MGFLTLVNIYSRENLWIKLVLKITAGLYCLTFFLIHVFLQVRFDITAFDV